MSKLSDVQIKHMVERFLTWKLPDDFNPDGGVEFKRTVNKGSPMEHTYNPVGTNLLTFTQASAMVRHMLDGLPPDFEFDGLLADDDKKKLLDAWEAHKAAKPTP